MTRKWGKAGQRLTPQSAREGYFKALAPQARDRALREARRGWQEGRVIPARITAALDLCGLYGPDVDERCGAREPDVDRWEQGELYPTWEQLLALADLTGFPPKFFVTPQARLESIWLCGRDGCTALEHDPVLVFTAEAIAAMGSPA